MKMEMTHKLMRILDGRNSCNFKITFRDAEAFVLKELYPVDFSIYGKTGQWSGEIVALIAPLSKLMVHKVGNGLDFIEDDVQEILDLSTGQVVFSLGT